MALLGGATPDPGGGGALTNVLNLLAGGEPPVAPDPSGSGALQKQPPPAVLLTIELREGGVLRATRSVVPGAVEVTTDFQLTSAEVASIVNPAALELWVTADAQGEPVRGLVTQAKLTLPTSSIPQAILLGGPREGSFLDSPDTHGNRAEVGWEPDVDPSQLVGADIVGAVASNDATASLTVAGLSVAATAAESFDSTATLTLAGLSVAAIVPATSTAALTLAGLSVAATSAESFDATAALTLAGLQVDATVSADIPTPLLFGGIIDGSALVNPFSAWTRADITQQEETPAPGLLSQLVTHDTTADLTLAGLSVAAAAAESFDSSAALTLAGLSVAATTTESFDTTAALTVAGLQVDAVSSADIAIPVLVGGLVEGSALLSPFSAWSRADVTQQEETPAPSLVSQLVTYDVVAGLTLAGLQVDATAAESFDATAALTLAGLSVAATVPATSTAALTLAGLSVAAVAVESFDATAALTTAGLQVDAVVSADIPTPLLLGGVIDGSALVGPFAVWTRSDVAYQEDVPAPGLVTQVVISLSFDATAALTLAGLQVDATSTEVFTSTAALTLAGLSVAAAAVESFDATASLTTAGLQVDAAASTDIAIPLLVGGIIDGSALLSPFAVWTRADVSQQEETPPPSLVAPLLVFDVTADLTLAGLSVAAVATETFPSTAALTLAGLSVSSVGAETFSFTAALTTAGLAVAARVPATSTAVLTTAGLSVAAAVQETFSASAALTLPGLSVAASVANVSITAALTLAGLQVAAEAAVMDLITPLVFPSCPTGVRLAISTTGCDLQVSLRRADLLPSIVGAEPLPSIVGADLTDSSLAALLVPSREGVLIPC